MPKSASIDPREAGPVYALHRGLEALGRSGRGIQTGDVAGVEAFWSADAMDVASCGFVLRLQDGRRLYLDVWVEPATDPEGEDTARPPKVDIEVVPLAVGQRYPHFPSPADPVGGWREDVATLNDFLERASPAG
jgi:hypothetical protein